MAARGGSNKRLSIGGRTFAVAADNDPSMEIGGIRTEIQPNGDGRTVRYIQTPKPWTISGVEVSVDHNQQDLEGLSDIAASGEAVPVELELAAGVVFDGAGTITSEVAMSTQKATVTIDLGGGGGLSQQ